jgi:hypothetical protein
MSHSVTRMEKPTGPVVVSAPKSHSPLIPADKASNDTVGNASKIDSKGATSPASPVGEASPPPVVVEGSNGHPSANGEGLKATPPTSPVEATSEANDPRLVELARKERLIREEARRVAAEKAELASMQATRPGAMTADEWKAKFLADPASVGMSYQEMADRYLSQPSEGDQKMAQLEAKIAELEGKLGQGNKVLEEAQAKAYANAMNQLRAESTRLIEASPKDYELISSQGAQDSIVKLIETTYNEEGRLMSVQDAAQQVESYLLERALKIAGLEKVRAKTSPVAPVAPPQTEEVKRSTTLSNTMSTSPRLTPQQIRERAIARARGQQ